MKNPTSEIIRKKRKAARLTQRELAGIIGRAHETICRYEKGVIDPPSSVLYRIIEICDRLSGNGS
jgi:predicted transcriptional regulator